MPGTPAAADGGTDMKGIAGRAAAVVVLGGLAAGAAFGNLPEPDPVSDGASKAVEIVQLKVEVEKVKLDAVKVQASVPSQKSKDEVAVILQALDSIYAKLEDMLSRL